MEKIQISKENTPDDKIKINMVRRIGRDTKFNGKCHPCLMIDGKFFSKN